MLEPEDIEDFGTIPWQLVKMKRRSSGVAYGMIRDTNLHAVHITLSTLKALTSCSRSPESAKRHVHKKNSVEMDWWEASDTEATHLEADMVSHEESLHLRKRVGNATPIQHWPLAQPTGHPRSPSIEIVEPDVITGPTTPMTDQAISAWIPSITRPAQLNPTIHFET
ncbi:hypothetical protein HWV62_15611 [Athelia sp. TMB]|nr:hypothetical protein HWV62_15611 [Athelia sp. TMB]